MPESGNSPFAWLRHVAIQSSGVGGRRTVDGVVSRTRRTSVGLSGRCGSLDDKTNGRGVGKLSDIFVRLGILLSEILS